MGVGFKRNFVLIVDDDNEDYKLIAREFSKYNIKSFYAMSAEEMEVKIHEIYHKLTAIVLDIKGKKSKDQSIENPDFINRAIRILDSNPNYNKIKKFIASGSPDDFDKFKTFNSEIMAYTKDLGDLNLLAKEIVIYGDSKDEVLIMNEYKDIYEAISRVKLGNQRERDLQIILLNKETKDKREITNYLGSLRRINEYVYKSIAQVIPKIANESTFAKINKELAGNRDYHNCAKITTKFYYKDSAIERAIQTIHWIGSAHGAHDDETLELTDLAIDSQNFPTNYTLKTVLYSLLDVILWYDGFMYKVQVEGTKK